MSVRKLVLLGLAVAVYVHCRGNDNPAKPVAPTRAAARTATAALHEDPNRADLIVLRAAMLRLRKIDITAGELRLEGQAVDDKEQPVGGATITLNHQRTVTAEADGSFAFDDLAAGDYELTAEHGTAYGENSYTLDEHSDPDAITLNVGPTLVMHVADHAGTPVLGAKVTPRNHLDAYTDRDGKASFRGMELGNDKVEIVAPGYASERTTVDVGDDPRRTIDRKVVLQPSAAIGGVVVDETDKPVPHAHVSASSSTHNWSDSTEADDHGTWKLSGFGAGKLTLSASTDVDVATPAPVVPIDGTTSRFDLVIHVERGATIDGTVVDEANHPLAGVHVTAAGTSIDTDDKGHFHVVGVDPGKATVSASTDTLGAADQAVDVPRGGHLDVRLVMVVSSIAGVVTNGHGQPIANADVMASGAGNAFEHTDELGHFDLHGLPPGDYVITATRESESVFADAKGVPVHSGNRHVALVIPDSASITGRVLLDGQPVDYFGIVIAEEPKNRGTPELQRSPDGRFTHSDLRPGNMAVVIVGPSFERKVIDDVVVTAGQQTDLGDIAVTRGASLHGHVVDASGMPIADAVVVVQGGPRLENDISLRNQIDDTRGTRSDASGHFEVAGLPADLAELQIQASDPERGLALPRELTAADLDHDIELVIAATGSLAGTIVNNPAELNYFVKVTSRADSRSYSAFSGDGDFTIDQLPPGEYLASLDSDLVLPPAAFRIIAGQTTNISFTHPATLITVNITTVGYTCTGVVFAAPAAGDVLTAADRHWIALASCLDPQHAALEHVAPGRYQLCNTGCMVVDIGSAPDRQTVTLIEKSDEPPADPPTPATPSDPSPTPDPAEPDPPAAADEGASTAE